MQILKLNKSLHSIIVLTIIRATVETEYNPLTYPWITLYEQFIGK